MNMMSEDAKTILMLCGHLGGDSDHEPLNQREYNQVVRWLLDKKLSDFEECSGVKAIQTGKHNTAFFKANNVRSINLLCCADPDFVKR